MNILVVYDSAYGNTAKVATAMSNALKEFGSVRLLRIGEVQRTDLEQADMLFIGSPTQGGRATEPTMNFIGELPDETIKAAKFAVFDTRFDAIKQKKALRLLMKVIGYGAPKMAAAIIQKGGTVLSEPQGFIVSDKEGPLRSGELEEAAAWVREIVRTSQRLS